MKKQCIKGFTVLLVLLLSLSAVSCGPSGNSGGSTNSHVHSWKKATCKNPETCVTCLETRGSVLDHNYQNGTCTMCKEKDPVQEQIDKGQKVYDKLTDLNVITEIISDSVYQAWHFAIYESDDDIYVGDYDYGIKAFASKVGLKSDAVIKAIDQELDAIGWTSKDDMSRFAMICGNSGAVKTVLRVYQNTGSMDIVSETFDEAKALLKEMDSKYEDKTYYSTLMSYYTDSLAYYNFVVAPNCSFAQLSSTLTSHTSKLESYKVKLSFVYDN